MEFVLIIMYFLFLIAAFADGNIALAILMIAGGVGFVYYQDKKFNEEKLQKEREIAQKRYEEARKKELEEQKNRELERRKQHEEEKRKQEEAKLAAQEQTITEESQQNGIHVIGVRFDSSSSGCYYYLGDNSEYNLGDRVYVDTANNGKQEVSVVFKKIYYNEKDLPYSLSGMKKILGKVHENRKVDETKNNDEEKQLNDAALKWIKDQLAKPRYIIDGVYGDGWESLIMTLSGIDKQTFDNMMDASAEMLEIGKQQSKKTINYLIHTIMVLLDENIPKSKLEGNGKGANFTFFMAVNLCVLYVYRNEKFTTDDIIDMQKRYEDDFRHCRYLTDKSLSDREQLLYTIVAINVLSSAIACTAIPGVYLTERIYEDTFFENIFNMYVEWNR